MRPLLISAVTCCLILLMGCATDVQRNKYYNFNITPLSIGINNTAKLNIKHIVVHPIQLATFLDQQGLVIQIDKHQIYTSKYHRWAQPLQELLSNKLIQELNKQSHADYVFNKKTPLTTTKPSLHLYIDVEQFNSTNHSQIILSGQFWLSDENETLRKNNHFVFKEQLNKDGYQHSVVKLELTIAKLATKINALLVE
ncbi:MAG: hypothetical protein COB62_06820 [Piscirickettsiaceae bacterium]|nr:MAG: hypothetical protein COB62_06820 [Piscirickettsiaceae bacterium]